MFKIGFGTLKHLDTKGVISILTPTYQTNINLASYLLRMELVFF